MWFSGLRGAIAYALSLHLEFGEDTRKVLVTTTLVNTNKVVRFYSESMGEHFKLSQVFCNKVQFRLRRKLHF